MNFLKAGVAGACIGLGMQVISMNMKEVEDLKYCTNLKNVKDYNIELFDSLKNINSFIKNQESAKGFHELSITLSKLICLEQHINSLPRMRKYTTHAIKYKRHICKILDFLKIHIQETKALEAFKKIDEACKNLCHNIQLSNQIIYE